MHFSMPLLEYLFLRPLKKGTQAQTFNLINTRKQGVFLFPNSTLQLALWT